MMCVYIYIMCIYIYYIYIYTDWCFSHQHKQIWVIVADHYWSCYAWNTWLKLKRWPPRTKWLTGRLSWQKPPLTWKSLVNGWFSQRYPPIDSASRGIPDRRLPRKICSSSRRHRRLSPGQRRTATSTWLQDADLITVGWSSLLVDG